MKIAYIKVAVAAAFAAMLFLPYYQELESIGDNQFIVYLNGERVGIVDDVDRIDLCLINARKKIAEGSDEIVLADCSVTYEGSEVLWGEVDDDSVIIDNMASIIERSIKDTLKRSYTVKINEYTVNLANTDEVLELLQASLGKYDVENEYSIGLVLDPERELNVLTTAIYAKAEESEEEQAVIVSAGINSELTNIFDAVEPEVEKEFSDYELGLKDIGFGDSVEVVEAYLQDSELTPVNAAIDEVTKEQEKEQIYEVVAGDTLSKIAMNNGLEMDRLIAMNETLESENSIIRVGDELIITVPEPELSVERVEEVYYEEDYEADIIYIDNNDWYTTQTKTLQEPSAGHRIVVADVFYRNSEEVGREILKEEITYEAVPKRVERGTKIPPTYIKPISGGRQSSGFGYRKAPTKGASSYHQGVDWATPVGTAVMASSSGTVARAGWIGSYGNAIYINHPDGTQTRYGHLSKILVSPGQTVSQGQKIALSGNTGVSTGPHVHFEIVINGSRVNPLKYLN
ncbi:MAG: M23 family metallopeptidase [Butyrivibrio sp.]|nr:M23 family metallopeptidase [Butyrivibrio sp.]